MVPERKQDGKGNGINAESTVWSTAPNRKRSKDLMFLLGLIETICLFAMTNSVCLYGHVLKKVNGHVLRMTLDFKVEVQRKKG